MKYLCVIFHDSLFIGTFLIFPLTRHALSLGVSVNIRWGAAAKLGINSLTFRNSSLDQLRLLRSQHKMARLLLVAALCLASVKAAVIPVEEIVDNLQVWFSLDFQHPDICLLLE